MGDTETRGKPEERSQFREYCSRRMGIQTIQESTTLVSRRAKVDGIPGLNSEAVGNTVAWPNYPHALSKKGQQKWTNYERHMAMVISNRFLRGRSKTMDGINDRLILQ